MEKIKALIILTLFLSLIIAVSIRSVEADSGVGNATFGVAASVNYTQDELDEMELLEITNPRNPYSLGFVSESFTPTENLDERLQAKAQEFNTPNYQGKNYTYGFVMILGRVTPEKLQNLTEYGVRTLGYHSPHSYKAKIPLNSVDEVNDLPFVKWVGYSTIKQKLATNLLNKINVVDNEIFIDNNDTEEIPVYINLFEDDRSGEMAGILEQKGVKIKKYGARLFYYSAYASPKVIQDILPLDFVFSVEKQMPLKFAHDESMASISADYLRYDYDGLGVGVGIIDSGYEKDHQDLFTADGCEDFVGNDCYEDPIGHGTHVAGTIWGEGNADSKYLGVAPEVKKFIAKVSDNVLDEGVDAMNWLAENTTADIVSMSMGVSELNCNGTDVLSRELDDHVYYDKQIYVVAAGNNIINSTIWQPGCAKNAITVGAINDSEEEHTDNLWYSSSKGPTRDGRKKPDVVAPGCVITSADYQDSYGYTEKCATSFATPHVSGLVATLLEHYPSWEDNASTVKAVLSATALIHEGDVANVGNMYGHGKVDSYLSHWIRNNPNGWVWGWVYGTVTGDTYSYYNITVPNDTDRLVVVLTWTEPAASADSPSSVINNLDLWVDKDGNEVNCSAGEWHSSFINDSVEYVYIDNLSGGTFKLKFCNTNINDTFSPQEYRAAYMIIRGDPTPSLNLTETLNDTTVSVGEQFSVTATVKPTSYVASGVYTKIRVPEGINITSMSTTRKDNVIMNYGSDSDINLGDIHEGDDRSVTWTLNATSSGTKIINVSISSDNAGTNATSMNVTVSLLSDGESCAQDSECQSNYCDSDGVGLADDGWCFTPYNTYFDGQENTYCEYSTNNGVSDCDERQAGDDLNLCVGTSYYEEECSSSCSYQDVVSVFECGETNCSCSEPLCDGLTTGSNITTCASAETYFADKCTSTAGGEDKPDNICRNSTFAAGCTADAECNGVVADTGNCNISCSYSIITTPMWTALYNNGTILPNTDGNWTINLSDDISLSYYTLMTNESGSYVNETLTAISGATINISGVKINLSAGEVCAKFWFNDTADNVNVANESCLFVNDYLYPAWSSLTNNGNIANNTDGNWSVTLNDNVGLSYYVFMDNSTGSMNNNSFVAISGTEANVSVIKTSLQLGEVCGRFWFNDTNNQATVTDESCIQIMMPPITGPLWLDSTYTDFFNNANDLNLSQSVGAKIFSGKLSNDNRYFTVNDSGIVALYSLDDTSNGFNNIANNGNRMSNMGSFNASGYYGNARNSTGVQYLQINASDNWDNMTQGTIAMWGHSNDTSLNDDFFFDTSNDENIEAFMSANIGGGFYLGFKQQNVNSNYFYAKNTTHPTNITGWHHYAATWGNNMSLYFDGTQMGYNPHNQDINWTRHITYFMHASHGSGFHGSIDHIAVFDYQMSEQDLIHYKNITLVSSAINHSQIFSSVTVNLTAANNWNSSKCSGNIQICDVNYGNCQTASNGTATYLSPSLIGVTYKVQLNTTDVNQECSIDKTEIILSYAPPDKNKFFVKNSTGEVVAWFGDAGNVVLKGILEENSNHQRTTSNEWIINNNDEDVLILDTVNGSLYIDGLLFENQETLNPLVASDDFIVKNSSGSVMIYVNESGYLFLRGNVIENGNP